MSQADSSEAVIQARGLTKVYRVYARPADRLAEAFLGGRRHREVRVLEGIDLDIQAGHTVGIVGRNGSGKSTLLKIVAGILRPTAGSVRVRGSVAAVLELGSGINPDATGRENILLSAAVHGLSVEEARARYDEVADYSELGEFLDQPVKTYSSGMAARLAFACAIHVNREILIVDETLSVGDAMFKRKCMATIESIKASGRTILFVSHAAETVKALCDHAVLLEGGRVALEGEPRDVLNEYTRLCLNAPRLGGQRSGAARPASSTAESAQSPTAEPRTRPQVELPRELLVPLDLFEVSEPEEFPYGTGEAEIDELEWVDDSGRPRTVFSSGDWAVLRYRVRFAAEVEQPVFGMTLRRTDGVKVYGTNSLHQGLEPGRIEAGDEVRVECRLPLRLAPGNYFITVGCAEFRDGERVFLHRRCDALLLRLLPTERFIGVANLGATMTVHRSAEHAAA